MREFLGDYSVASEYQISSTKVTIPNLVIEPKFYSTSSRAVLFHPDY
jgi:hypothetical protein